MRFTQELMDGLPVGTDQIPDENDLPYKPSPIMGKPWGKNRFIVWVIPNQPYKRSSGIIVSETELTQDIPHCGVIVAVSDAVDRELYPELKVGATVMFRPNTGDTWEWNGHKWSCLDAMYVRMSYEPKTAHLEAPDYVKGLMVSWKT